MVQRPKSISAKRTAKKKRRFARVRVRRTPTTQSVGAVAAPLPPVPLLWNLKDNLVVHTLAGAEFGDLSVDRFADFLRDKESDAKNPVAALRQGLIEVYQEAGNQRQSTKASLEQIHTAQVVLRSLKASIKRLDRVKPREKRFLETIFGGPPDDHKGIAELNNFAANCWQVKLDLAKIVSELERAIEVEKEKPSKAGERKKRLRTLVEALADWWRSKIGESIAPYVYAKKLGKGIPAFVVGRQGDFIELAQALLSNIDVFKESEVISAVTNVYEDRLQRKKQ